MSKASSTTPFPGAAMSVFRKFGLLISLACCGWVGWVLWQEVSSEALATPLDRWVRPFLLAVGGGVLVNAGLGVAWRELVMAQGVAVRVRDSIGLSWRVQICKYIPGNVFHLAGRVTGARRLGIARDVAARATLLEALLMVGVAGVISLGWWTKFTGQATWWVGGAALVGLLGLGLGWSVKQRWGSVLPPRPGRWHFSGRAIATLGVTFTTLFFLLAGMFSLFLPVVAAAPGRTFFSVLEMVTFSWAVGFVAIGAPGGLGVRETVLMLFAETPREAHALLLIGVLTRAAMVAGDAVSLGLGLLVRPAREPTDSPTGNAGKPSGE